MASLIWLVILGLLVWVTLAMAGGLFHVLSFLLVGALAGWLAGQFTRGRGFGLFKNVLIGIVGAFVGGVLFNIAGFRSRGLIASVVTATVGSVILLSLAKWLQTPVKSR
jgi:uncharacterized membrane protein YeaQ/YmgE (transglycosylase-associated protein family)